jgi:hypothetical protein
VPRDRNRWRIVLNVSSAGSVPFRSARRSSLPPRWVYRGTVRRGSTTRNFRPSIGIYGGVRNRRFVCGRGQDVSGVEQLERNEVALARSFGAPRLGARARCVAGSGAGARDPGFSSRGAQDRGLGEASLKPRGGALCFGVQIRKLRPGAMCSAALSLVRASSKGIHLTL